MRGIVLNRTECAATFGVAATTVDSWVRKSCPVVKAATGRGSGANRWQFDSAAVAEWLRAQAIAGAVGKLTTASGNEARRRKLTAEAALSELELAKKSGELVAVADVEVTWSRLVSNFRTRMLAMPSKLAGPLVGIAGPAVINSRLQDAIHEALAELSDERKLQRVAAGRRRGMRRKDGD
jgi:phage terminase Nu1 subunit (DNA packaging protein)